MLRAMTDQEFDAYSEHSTARYAAEVARNTLIIDEAARAQAERSTVQELPDGMHTTGHRLLIVEDATGQRVGHMWLAHKPETDRLYIFDIEIDEAARGKGYGRRAMDLIVDEARAMGVSRIELNVFADNPVARHLYETAGYREMSRQMVKLLD
jgi:ribosomal protein S18 acetylase RimI-like enzyme